VDSGLHESIGSKAGPRVSVRLALLTWPPHYSFRRTGGGKLIGARRLRSAQNLARHKTLV
jgi:hypothetical protein